MNSYIKCPINYMGNKYKLLEQIIPLFPTNIDQFVDLFGGSFTMGINVKANTYIYNEINAPLYSLVNYLIKHDFESIDEQLRYLISFYELEKGNKVAYKKLKDDYNCGCDSSNQGQNISREMLLFLLICYGFNYQLRYNKKGEYNIPCGNRDYSLDMQKHLKNFVEKTKSMDIKTTNLDYREVPIDINSFVYIDPPYLQTLASYNENGGWNADKEKELYEYIDNLDKNGIRFALSNTSYYHDKKNDLLLDWAKKYELVNLNHNYTNNNRFGKNNKQYTQEILVKNY